MVALAQVPDFERGVVRGGEQEIARGVEFDAVDASLVCLGDRPHANTRVEGEKKRSGTGTEEG